MTRMTILIFLLASLLSFLLPSTADAGYRDGMNHYEYVQSSPVVNVDPMGLMHDDARRTSVWYEGIPGPTITHNEELIRKNPVPLAGAQWQHDNPVDQCPRYPGLESEAGWQQAGGPNNVKGAGASFAASPFKAAEWDGDYAKPKNPRRRRWQAGKETLKTTKVTGTRYKNPWSKNLTKVPGHIEAVITMTEQLIGEKTGREFGVEVEEMLGDCDYKRCVDGEWIRKTSTEVVNTRRRQASQQVTSQMWETSRALEPIDSTFKADFKPEE